MAAFLAKETRKIENAKPAEQMFLFNLLAKEYLGSKWQFFHKIKHANEGFDFLKQSNLMEQMKATRSALGFSSKNTKKAYRVVYQNCITDIKKYTGKSDFRTIEEDDVYPKNYEYFDSLIISWTPLKFFLPASQIRQKGTATQRHSEGLVAKLYFKALAYYAIPQNWNANKLTLYLSKIDVTSTYQDIVAALEPLKKDLDSLVENYQAFKFGEASLAKDAEQDENSFDDAMGGESFVDQLKTLYWYYCLYIAMEQFIFRYMLLLLTSTSSTIAIRYIAKIFEPIISKSIEIRALFLGSLETKSELKKFRESFKKIQIQYAKSPLTKTIKTKIGTFEIYPFNQNFLSRYGMDFEIHDNWEDNSEWADFIRFKVLGWEKPIQQTSDKENNPEEEEEPKDPIDLEVREYALMQIMSVMVQCIQLKRDARHKILERFKEHIKFEKERSLKNIERIRKNTEKKQRGLERKMKKFERLKQKDTVQAMEKDILELQRKSGSMCNNLIKHTKIELHRQKGRLIELFHEIAKEDTISPGEASKQIIKLVDKLDKDGEFSKEFTRFVADNIQDNYTQELEPFYENIFEILEPSTQEKLVFIQAIKKAGSDIADHLTLTDEEQKQIDETLKQFESKIKSIKPDIFESKVVFLSLVIPIQKLFDMSLDKKSLYLMLTLKMTSPSNPKASPLRPDIVKALLLYNQIKNPVPSNNLILAGQESATDPAKAINKGILNKLLS